MIKAWIIESIIKLTNSEVTQPMSMPQEAKPPPTSAPSIALQPTYTVPTWTSLDKRRKPSTQSKTYFYSSPMNSSLQMSSIKAWLRSVSSTVGVPPIKMSFDTSTACRGGNSWRASALVLKWANQVPYLGLVLQAAFAPSSSAKKPWRRPVQRTKLTRWESIHLDADCLSSSLNI